MENDIQWNAFRDIVLKAMRGSDTPKAVITEESVLRNHFGDELVDEAIADGQIQPLDEDDWI